MADNEQNANDGAAIDSASLDKADNCYIGLFINPVDVDATLSECQKRFEAGDARSGFWLGVYYVKKGDEEKAADYYEQSAEMGDVWSSKLIGMKYMHAAFRQSGDVSHFDSAIKYIEFAAQSGYGDAQFVYAHIFDRVRKVERNLDLAWDYYNRAADNGNTAAMMKLAWFYLYGDTYGNIENCYKGPDTFEFDKDYDYLQDPNYSRDSYKSLNIVCDEEKGILYATKAAQLGSSVAMYELMRFYHYVKKDDAKAVYWAMKVLVWELPSYGDDYLSWLFASSVDTGVSPSMKTNAKEILSSIPKEVIINSIEPAIDYWQYACEYKDYSWHYQCK